MNRFDEALRKIMEGLATAPRFVRKVRRVAPDNGSGILEQETRLTGLHEGVLKTLEEKQECALSCGHVSVPAILCQFHDEQMPGDHYACPACSSICSGCQLAGCARHFEIIDDKRFCAACARNSRLDALWQSLLGCLVRFFQ